jgi:hypothetical protein
MVEASGTLACKLEMLRLIMADRHMCGFVYEDICCLQDRI